jgi:hypothetical protein
MVTPKLNAKPVTAGLESLGNLNNLSERDISQIAANADNLI